ncbi:BfmA/BtgA family mobilization protein [Mucilaginibacter sp.]|uniref:BfmA/BtgA family mobilization protein n=1 Tax=Mucilaginibacter sp. TaxID=1882438 RepID=UPI00283EC8B9|nr:BfmA/BtgA family mobilization protein [Mucilaginibacter sp.]MDR3697714.1 BfmA/BtgA family mobilization protein [Mucilaginibacter sp.]
MEDINVKSVRYPELTDQKFEKIALKLGRTKRRVFIQMVDYFYKSKKDPMDLNDELLKNTLMKNHQQYIGFIKTQENMLLVPMKILMDKIGESQRQIIESFNTEVLTQNVDVIDNQHALAKMFGEIARLMESILQSQKSKEMLKAQFISILEAYIKSREAFTLMTPGREKEELIAITKEQVKLL